MNNKIFYLAAAIITDNNNRLLVVRKRDTHFFMLPGGKIEIDETPLAALLREINEELNITLLKSQPQFINTYRAPAANEPDYQIESNLFRIKLDNTPLLIPAAEIEEARWITAREIPTLRLAPLIESYIIPLWLSEQID